MSIILDALKKAEEKKKGTSFSESSPPEKDQNQKGFSFRDLVKIPKDKRPFFIFAVVIGLVLGGVIFWGTSEKSPSFRSLPEMGSGQNTNSQTPSQAQTLTAKTKMAEEQKSQKIASLKEEAIKNFHEHRLQETLVQYAQLMMLSPDDPGILNNYAVALRHSGQTSEAKKIYEKILVLKPDYPEALNNYAVILLTEKSYDLALATLTRAIELDPNYVEASLHAAIAYEKLGKISEAKDHYQKFLEQSRGRIDRKIRLQVESRLVKLREE